MDRRTFLQVSGMTAAGMLLAGCKPVEEKLIPFLVAADEGITPGAAEYFATSCRGCPAGCGILVRVSEGRARKIEGNPAHPVNRGKLCARGQAMLQELYHPDRIPQPMKRTGPRGSGKFARISWEEGLEILTWNLKSLRQAGQGERLALLTPHLRGTVAEVVARFMDSIGSPNHLSFALLGFDWLRDAGRLTFGTAALPWYDMAETRYLLSFGADFVENHLSPVHYGNAFGRMRQGRDTVRGHFTYVGGRMSLTCASADRWMPARPGTEGVLALGMARVMLEEGLVEGGSDQLIRTLDEFRLDRVARQTDLPTQVITEVAREFATTRPAVAMVGEGVAFHTNGMESVRAVQLLNLLVGNLGRPGGIYIDGTAPEGPTGSFAELLSLTGKMKTGRIQTALIKGDPVHTIPRSTGFQEALARVPFLVSFATLPDDTAMQADLILPDHSPLESWGDVIPVAGARIRVIGVMQPVTTPLLDTRQFPEVLMKAANEASDKAPFSHNSYGELFKETMKKRLGPATEEESQAKWTELLSSGGLFLNVEKAGKEFRSGNLAVSPPGEAKFAGEDGKYPFHLQVYPSTAFNEGSGAALPWLQQLPDPMTTVVWDSWLEINPQAASRLGIAFGDLVEVTSPMGSLRLPAFIYPGIRPDMVAIPLGQWHRDMGRYARNRGVNPLDLVVAGVGEPGPAPFLNATRVRVARVSGKGGMVTAGHPEGSYRMDLLGI